MHSLIQRLVVSCGVLFLVGCVGDDPVRSASSSGAPAEAGAMPDGGSGETGAPSGKKLAFVTKMFWDGKLGSGTGGIEAGDKRCNEEANLPGRTFVAWLSHGAKGAIDRVGAGPWELADGASVGDRAKLAGNDVKIFRDASGAVVTGEVWTGTAVGGIVGALYCDEWTNISAEGLIGQINGAGETWTHYSGNASCNQSYHLYCLEL